MGLIPLEIIEKADHLVFARLDSEIFAFRVEKIYQLLGTNPLDCRDILSGIKSSLNHHLSAQSRSHRPLFSHTWEKLTPIVILVTAIVLGFTLWNNLTSKWNWVSLNRVRPCASVVISPSLGWKHDLLMLYDRWGILNEHGLRSRSFSSVGYQSRIIAWVFLNDILECLISHVALREEGRNLGLVIMVPSQTTWGL